jgi:hypothetical protein
MTEDGVPKNGIPHIADVMRMWWKAEADIISRRFLNARLRYPLAMSTVPQKRLYSETSLGLLARVFYFGISESAERQKADDGYGR